MKRSVFGILIGASLAFGTAAASFAAEDADAYAKGRDAIFAEDWARGERLFEDFLRRFPASAWSDDAHYWLGMALYERGQADRAYATLKTMDERHPGSPWADDARVLMLRCAETLLRHERGDGPLSGQPGNQVTVGSGTTEYEAFIERSTRDRSSKVQLLAIDTMLVARPEKAAEFLELLPRLSGAGAPREATGLVLDRFFGDSRVKVTIERYERGFTEENVAVIVRSGDQVVLLHLSEALEELVRPATPSQRFNAGLLGEIREKLVSAEQSLIREGGPGTIELAPRPGIQAHSAIVKVVDGEVHYYRGSDETLRVVVLNKGAGFRADNVRIFVESASGVTEIHLAEARSLTADGARAGLSVAALRYLQATLAIIEISLTRP